MHPSHHGNADILGDGKWNDPIIPDNDWLYRRVPRKPDFLVQHDLLDRKPVVSRNAFRFDSDGMSVYRLALMTAYGLTAHHVRRSSSSHVVFRVLVGEVRKLLVGVIDKEDPNDGILGKAHALVRGEGHFKPVEKEVRRRIQEGLTKIAEYIDLDSDPGQNDEHFGEPVPAS